MSATKILSDFANKIEFNDLSLEAVTNTKRHILDCIGVGLAATVEPAGQTIIDMVKKMRRYVFPPSMDFVRYNQIQPFAMYIFEFTHNLTRQDLSNIWQNLPPKIGNSFEESTSSISHHLLAHELMGGGSVIDDGELDQNAKGNIPRRTPSWRVFLPSPSWMPTTGPGRLTP